MALKSNKGEYLRVIDCNCSDTIMLMRYKNESLRRYSYGDFSRKEIFMQKIQCEELLTFLQLIPHENSFHIFNYCLLDNIKRACYLALKSSEPFSEYEDC